MIKDRLDGRFEFIETGRFHTMQPFKLLVCMFTVFISGIILFNLLSGWLDNYQRELNYSLHSPFSRVGNIFISAVTEPIMNILWVIMSFFAAYAVSTALFETEWKYYANDDFITFTSKRESLIYKYLEVDDIEIKDFVFLFFRFGIFVTITKGASKKHFKYIYPHSMINKTPLNTPFGIIIIKKKEKLQKLKEEKEKEEKIRNGEIPEEEPKEIYDPKFFAEGQMESISVDDFANYIPSNLATDENREKYFSDNFVSKDYTVKNTDANAVIPMQNETAPSYETYSVEEVTTSDDVVTANDDSTVNTEEAFLSADTENNDSIITEDTNDNNNINGTTEDDFDYSSLFD